MVETHHHPHHLLT